MNIPGAPAGIVSQLLSPFSPGSWRVPLLAALATLPLLGTIGVAAENPPAAAPDFGRDIELAPFEVQGKRLTVAIHARTKADRRYAEKFADEVVEVAYETLGDFSGTGLVIVGAEGELHPVTVLERFLELAHTGQLDAGVAESAGEVDVLLKQLRVLMKVDGDSSQETGVTFDTLVPALPMPLEGAASRLFQLAWVERFDSARIENRLKAITLADLARDEFSRYEWVFYLPPRSAASPVFKDMMNKSMAAQKVGFLQRNMIRSAVFVFSPVVKGIFEAGRKGMLFLTILRAKSSYSKDDIEALTTVYIRAMMPDLKPGSGDTRRRALEAIEAQKVANADYAKDPFVAPTRLASYDPASFTSFVGAYAQEPQHVTHRFTQNGEVFEWIYKDREPTTFYPAGERLFVNAEGTMTIQFLIDDQGSATAVEERWVRRRQTIPRAMQHEEKTESKKAESKAEKRRTRGR